MFTILFRSIKDRKISLIVYMISAMLFMWMYVAMFPSIAEQADSLAVFFDSLPDAMFEVFGMEDLNISTLENFLSVEHFSLVLPIMLAFLLVSVAGRAIAGEIETGTLELIIARSVSRLKLYLAKYAAGIGILIVFTIVSVFSVIPFAAMHGVEYAIKSIAAGALMVLLFGWAVFSTTMMFSGIFSERSRVYMAGGGILLGMYVLNIVALMKESLEALKYLSFFHYYAYSDALLHQSLYGTGCVVFICVSVFTTVAGAVWFMRRDIAV